MCTNHSNQCNQIVYFDRISFQGKHKDISQPNLVGTSEPDVVRYGGLSFILCTLEVIDGQIWVERVLIGHWLNFPTELTVLSGHCTVEGLSDERKLLPPLLLDSVPPIASTAVLCCIYAQFICT